MNLVLTAVVPLFILIGVGAFLKYLKVADESWIEVLNKFELYVGFPALIVYNISAIDGKNVARWDVIGYNFLLLVGLIVVGYLLFSALKLEQSVRNAYVICLFFGNVAYMGLPFISSVVKGSEPLIALHVALYIFVLFTFGIFILENSMPKKRTWWQAALHVLKSPLLISVFVAMFFFLAQVKLPALIGKPLQLIAACASPLALLKLGIFINQKLTIDRFFWHALYLSLLKVVAVPALFFGFMVLMKVKADFHVSLYEAAMPIAVTPFALSQLYPLHRKMISEAIVLSTIFSLVTLPLWVFLIQ